MTDLRPYQIDAIATIDAVIAAGKRRATIVCSDRRRQDRDLRRYHQTGGSQGPARHRSRTPTRNHRSRHR